MRTVKRHFLMEKNWQGINHSAWMEELPSAGDAVHRIKIDEVAGYVITTSRNGGLVVADLHHNQALWSLPKVYTISIHCDT